VFGGVQKLALSSPDSTRPIKRKLAHLKYVSVSAGVQAAEFIISQSLVPVLPLRGYSTTSPEEPDPQ